MKINYDLIGRALIHPVQRTILETYVTSGAVKGSAKEMAEITGLKLGTVSYHMRLLAGLNVGKQPSPFKGRPLLKRAGKVQRRGATENFYRLTEEATTDARS